MKRAIGSVDDGSGSLFMFGFVAGVALGAGAALLMAPKAGAELRSDLSRGMTSVNDAVRRAYRDVADRAGVQLENLEARAEAVAEQVHTHAREAVESARRGMA
jgi:gas vesicle protein